MSNPSLHDIVAAIFGRAFNPKMVHVASFAGDPHNKDEARWHGRRLFGNEILPATNNNFLCMGRLDPTTMGRSLRDVTHHVAFWMDDVGTKVPLARVRQLIADTGLRPTLVIETSPGNFSYTWALAPHVEEVPDHFDAQTVAAVRHRLKADGWGDPAAQDAARYMRLPGINGKAAYRQEDGSPFQSRVVEFEPANIVTLADFAGAILGADWIEDVKSGRYAPSQVLMSSVAGNNDRAASMEDPLVKLAEAVGLFPQPSTRPGVIDCHCPNEANHTGGDPTGYAIINDGMSYCNHASCQHLRSPDFQDLMIEKYDQQVQAGLMFGSLVENPLGPGIVDSVTGEEVPATGAGFLARARFENAPVEVDGRTPGMEAEELAERQRVRRAESEADAEAARQRLMSNLVYVDEAEAFWHKSKHTLMTPTRLERDEDVLVLFEVGLSGKKRAPHVLLNSGMVHVDTLVSLPGGKDVEVIKGKDGKPRTAINTYSPTEIGRRKGTPTKFIAHIANMFPNEPDTAKYLIEAMAWMLQNPNASSEVVVLLGGDPGIGKDFVLGCFKKLAGEHNVANTDTASLLDGFNDFLTSPYVYLGEFTLAGREGRQAYNALKSLTTPDLRRINPKYGKAYYTRVAPRFFATTNDTDALANVPEEDRRVFVGWSYAVRQHGAAGGASTPMSDAYFDDLWKTYNQTAELEILHDYLLTLPITVFNPHKAPIRTAARHQLLLSSLSASARFAYDLVVDGDLSGRTVISYKEVEQRALASDNQQVKGRVNHRQLREGLLLAGCKSLGQVRIGKDKPSLWTGSCLPSDGALTEADRKRLMSADPKTIGQQHLAEVAASAAAHAAA